ncbi:hypothetical protein ALO95_200066 [Pseudomonas syringae pv. antirrhini]|uniref:Indole-3-glycerol-phosphate synthase n=1 Tax=Pseudomonas syringae pv. antirrhini TaxID=251702 RepID=A0A0P9JJ53_9PSED|nr:MULTISPECIES: hypothetical protein [Pseudomonas]KPW47356.1 hypothetical protein ALO88_200020 [Pseudomonas syringae pv. antirrhini]RMP34224.1 hypothetical protein ALQ23_200073 [Pseudomonas syringae pv. antirrhini]RMP36892.1 hypothetical protein ALQ24_01809 [Pseudomonas syringae pv. antirrhini]RMW26098.1 hypothetical protein ALO95_200066 [Pseudomonas syringae pv. antirrhini]WIN06912.1 hypothetical protein QQF68_25640 [Pseudomonas syringae pv. antirrhini str. 126]
MMASSASGSAFDKRNLADFDNNTEIISSGLMAIAADTSIKATVAELSRITGIHRNTLRQRLWPVQRLKAIKEDRVVSEIRQRQAKGTVADPVSVLTDKLEASRCEVLHWFDQYLKANDRANQQTARVDFIKHTIPKYEAFLAERDSKLLELNGEIARLRQVIDVLQSERAEKNS